MRSLRWRRHGSSHTAVDRATREFAVAAHLAGVRAALSGLGLVLCGLVSSFDELRAGRLVAPLGPRLYSEYTYPYTLVWSAGRSLTPAMRSFRDWMLVERSAFLAEASKLVGLELR